MKRSPGFFPIFMLLGGMVILMSCNLPDQTIEQVDRTIATMYPTVLSQLTITARVTPSADNIVVLPSITQTTTPEMINQEATAFLTETPGVDLGNGDIDPVQGLEIPCNLAQAGKPLDISIPDETHLTPGEYFSKTWRFINAGSCTWTREYAVVWFSGDELGLSSVQFVGQEVSIGGQIEVTVEMIAPLTPGTYQSNWKMRDQQGQLFGIGPRGNAPFWVKIVVVPLNTPTVTATLPIASPTPVIFTSGGLSFTPEQAVDLDSGEVDQEENADLTWKQTDLDQQVLLPINGARISLYGLTSPEMADCENTVMSDAPFDLTQIQDGTFICYRTTQGLPGRLQITRFDQEQLQLDLEFQTWLVP